MLGESRGRGRVRACALGIGPTSRYLKRGIGRSVDRLIDRGPEAVRRSNASLPFSCVVLVGNSSVDKGKWTKHAMW